MVSPIYREQLHKIIDKLPDEVVQQIAEFTLFVAARREIALQYVDWNGRQWQDFSLEQFFREDDDIEYTLADAEEIYHP